VNLTFDDLIEGELGLTQTAGAYFAEAASYCLHCHKHANPVRVLLSGDLSGEMSLSWIAISDAHFRTHADLEESTEYGAYAIGIIIAAKVTGFSCVERSAKGTGIDFWLAGNSDERGIFQHSARLEVSGIFRGAEKTILTRVEQKLSQTIPTDSQGLPVYVAVVEFSSPEVRLRKKATAT
jgi:hypothetical protein